MHSVRRSLLFAVCLRSLLLLVLLANAETHAQSAASTPLPEPTRTKPWRILTVSLVDPLMPVSLVYIRSFKDALEAAAPGPVTFFSESFDAPNFDTRNVEDEMVAYLAKKYAAQPVDLVVAVTAERLDFIDKFHDKLWPGAPVIFTAVHHDGLRDLTALKKYPFVGWRPDVHGTLALMQSLRPDARRLVVIGGASDLDTSVLINARLALNGNDRWDVEYWTSFTRAQLRERLAMLPKDTMVLFTTLFKDASGAVSYPRDALEYIAEKSTVPVFAMFSSFAGHRMTAGNVLDVQQIGKEAAGLAIQMLTRKDRPLAEMQTFIASHCFADAKRLDEFGLSTKALPDDCDIQNPVRNLWTDYKAVVLVAAAVMLLQAYTIGSMFWHRRRRRAAELKNSTTQGELQRAMRFAAMGELTASIAHEINQPLGAILCNAEAAEMLLQSGKATREDLASILADIRRDDQRAHQVVGKLRTLLSKAETRLVPVALHSCIGDVMPLLTPEARRRSVTIELALNARHDSVSGDPVQLQQVLLNLVINALDALEGVDPALRSVHIETATADDHIALTVTDNGCGMNDETLKQAFASLFTTKQAGLGMGLSIVRAIVEAHSGTIKAQSQPGSGTVFTVRLPILKAQP